MAKDSYSNGTDYMPLIILGGVGVGLYLLTDNIKDIFGAGRSDKKEDKAAEQVEEKAATGDKHAELALRFIQAFKTLSIKDNFYLSEYNKNLFNGLALDIADFEKVSKNFLDLGKSQSNWFSNFTGNLQTDMQQIFRDPAVYKTWLIYAKSKSNKFAYAVGDRIRTIGKKSDTYPLFKSNVNVSKRDYSFGGDMPLGTIKDRFFDGTRNLYAVEVKDTKTNKIVRAWVFGTSIKKY